MKKTLLATIGLLALSAAAHAATVWNFDTSHINYTLAYAKVTSGTTPALLGDLTIDPTKAISVSGKGSVIASATLTFKDPAGNTLYSQAVAIGTTPSQLVSITAPQYFTKMGVSITTGAGLTGTNNVSLSMIQTGK